MQFAIRFAMNKRFAERAEPSERAHIQQAAKRHIASKKDDDDDDDDDDNLQKIYKCMYADFSRSAFLYVCYLSR